MGLPPELRLMIFKYLLTEEVQPTKCKRPHRIPICKVSEKLREEAYAAYLSSNNIRFKNARSACLWLGQISSYLGTEDEKPLHLTFDLDRDKSRVYTSRPAQRRLFRQLAQRTKLDLTIIDDCYSVLEQLRCGDLDSMHGFASMSSTQTPKFNCKYLKHHLLHQSYHHKRYL